MLYYCSYLLYTVVLSTHQLWNEWKCPFTMNLLLKPKYDIEAAKYVDVLEFSKEE
jgi:hypothetical protein